MKKRISVTLTDDQVKGLQKAARVRGEIQLSEVMRGILNGDIRHDVWRENYVLRGDGDGTESNNRSSRGGEAKKSGASTGGGNQSVDAGKQEASGPSRVVGQGQVSKLVAKSG
jgi:hypothetical protein